MKCTLAKSQNLITRARAAYPTHLPLFISPMVSTWRPSTWYLTPNSSSTNLACPLIASTKSLPAPGTKDSVNSDERAFKADMSVKQGAGCKVVLEGRWQIEVYLLPETDGKPRTRWSVKLSKDSRKSAFGDYYTKVRSGRVWAGIIMHWPFHCYVIASHPSRRRTVGVPDAEPYPKKMTHLAICSRSPQPSRCHAIARVLDAKWRDM